MTFWTALNQEILEKESRVWKIYSPPIFRINSKQVKLNKDFFKDQIIFRNTIIGYDLKKLYFEVPLQLGQGLHNVERIGGYTYYGDHFDAKFCESIGRFCIIGENVTIGTHEHCANSLTAHPMFFWSTSRFQNFHDSVSKESCQKNIAFHNRL